MFTEQRTAVLMLGGPRGAHRWLGSCIAADIGVGQRRTTNTQRKNRIAENINVFDFKLSAEEIAAIDGLDTGRRGDPEPDAITLETFGREIPEA